MFFFSFSPPLHWVGGEVSKQLCGAELPARLNHNSYVQKYSEIQPFLQGTYKKKITCDIGVFVGIRTVYPSGLCPQELAKS